VEGKGRGRDGRGEGPAPLTRIPGSAPVRSRYVSVHGVIERRKFYRYAKGKGGEEMGEEGKFLDLPLRTQNSVVTYCCTSQ